MFLCRECHQDDRCLGLDLRSHGRCEKCGTTATCLDCHNYNFSGLSDAEVELKVAEAMRGRCWTCGKPLPCDEHKRGAA